MNPIKLLTDSVRDKRKAHPSLRDGQAYFNALHEVDPKLADELSGTELDPYYVDSRIPDFLAKVQERWARHEMPLL